MSFEPVNLFFGMMFSSIGLAYFIYGKKQQVFVPMIVGAALMGYTFFVSNLTVMIVIGVILAIIPYFFRNS